MPPSGAQISTYLHCSGCGLREVPRREQLREPRGVGPGDLHLALDRDVPQRHVLDEVPVLLDVVVVERRDQHVVVQIPARAAGLDGALRSTATSCTSSRSRTGTLGSARALVGHRPSSSDAPRALAVRLDLADAVVGGDAADAAAARGWRSSTGRAPGSGCGSPRSRAPGRMWNSCSARELAVEDVAADQAPLLLHLVRPDHLAVQHGVGEPGRELVVAGDHAVGVGLELLGVRLLAPLVRHPLREQRDDVLALGRERADRSTVGITPSLNGAVAGAPARASSNARSRYAIECASSNAAGQVRELGVRR